MNFSLRFGNDFIRFRISSRVSFARFGRSILIFFKALRHSCSDNGSTLGSHKSGMNISMRTFPDSGNQSLLAFWKILDPFQGFFTGYDFFLRTLDFHLPFQCLHFCSLPKFTLHPVASLHQESFARAYASIRPCLYTDGNHVVVTIAFVRGGVVAQDVLLRQVRGDLGKGTVKIFH